MFYTCPFSEIWMKKLEYLLFFIKLCGNVGFETGIIDNYYFFLACYAGRMIRAFFSSSYIICTILKNLFVEKMMRYICISVDVTIYHKPVQRSKLQASTKAYLKVLKVEKFTAGYDIETKVPIVAFRVHTYIFIKAIYDCGQIATRGINPGSAVFLNFYNFASEVLYSRLSYISINHE